MNDYVRERISKASEHLAIAVSSLDWRGKKETDYKTRGEILELKCKLEKQRQELNFLLEGKK